MEVLRIERMLLAEKFHVPEPMTQDQDDGDDIVKLEENNTPLLLKIEILPLKTSTVMSRAIVVVKKR